MTVTMDGVANNHYSPFPSSSSNDVVVKTMSSIGAVIESSQWFGWVPVQDSCPKGSKDNLANSHFAISNVRVMGAVKQGPEPTKCGGPAPPSPSRRRRMQVRRRTPAPTQTSQNTTQPSPSGCWLRECGCPPFANDQDWCNQWTSSEWCRASESNCGTCMGVYCCGSGESSPTSRETPSPTSPETPPTESPTSSCYNKDCGCPPFPSGPSWCSETSAVVSSAWCQASASNCAGCNGVYCAGTSASLAQGCSGLQHGCLRTSPSLKHSVQRHTMATKSVAMRAKVEAAPAK